MCPTNQGDKKKENKNTINLVYYYYNVNNEPSYYLICFAAWFQQQHSSCLACVVYIKTTLLTSVLVKVVDIYLAALWLSKYPPLFTSTSMNNC